MEWTERDHARRDSVPRGFGPDMKPDDTELLIMKPRRMVEQYMKVVEKVEPKRIFELGIFHGDSVAFLAFLARPDIHVAIDYQPGPGPQFEDWVTSHDGAVRAFYGIDQADATTLRDRDRRVRR